MYRERLEILKDWKEYVGRIKAAAEGLLKGCEVHAFGSVISGGLTAASDIDVLVIAESLPKTLMERAKVKGEIERLANLPPYHPRSDTLSNQRRGETQLNLLKGRQGKPECVARLKGRQQKHICLVFEAYKEPGV